MKRYWEYFKLLYNKRNIVETDFSVIKKRGGDKITAKSLRMRSEQALLKSVPYNTSRFCDLVNSGKFSEIVMSTYRDR